MLKNKNIFQDIRSESDFKQAALEVFRLHYEHTAIYKKWVDLLKIKAKEVDTLEKIPFLPIEFFKHHRIVSGVESPTPVEFYSSGTTSKITSVHVVNDISIYEKSFLKCFTQFYGPPEEYCILALLPNYLERQGSSLVYMCNTLIKKSQHPKSGFFLNDLEALKSVIQELKLSSQKVLLIGVSYALMDLCDGGIPLNENFSVMETGGMKGTRKELLKKELHRYLQNGFQITTIHSEYGMTELLSQAYSKGEALFETPSWMKILIRDVNDPLHYRGINKTGGINVIDLANINSCSFIATKDLGKLHEDGRFEVVGRFTESDLRGCNLMLESYD